MDLQVADHDSFQRREWQAERVGWVVLALLVIAALVGCWAAVR